MGLLDISEDIVNQLTFFSDVFFHFAVKLDKYFLQYVYEILFDREDIKLDNIQTQHQLVTPDGSKDVIVDTICMDNDGWVNVLELQNDKAAMPDERIRYIQSKIDAVDLKKGANYKELCKLKINILAKYDYGGLNEKSYRQVRATVGYEHLIAKDKVEINIFNAIYRSGKKELIRYEKMMHDFGCKDPDDMYSHYLKNLALRIKRPGKEHDIMCDVISKALKRQEEIGNEKGEARELVHAVESFKKRGMTVEDYLQIVGKTMQEYIKALRLVEEF